MKKTVYMLEVGVLLDESHPEFDSYNIVYDKLWGYYNENNIFFFEKEKAMNYADAYVSSGVDFTYAIIQKDTPDLDEEEIKEVEESSYLYGWEHMLDNKILYAIYKDDKGKIHQNFVKCEYE